MVRLFGHYLSRSVIVLAIVETAALFGSVYLGAYLRLAVEGLDPIDTVETFEEYLTFVVTVQAVMLAFGLYQRETCRSLRQTGITLMAALPFSALVLALIFFLIPAIAVWRSVFVAAFAVTVVIVPLVRFAFVKIADLDRFKRRLLVLGAGRLAAKIGELEAEERSGGTVYVDFVRMGDETPKVTSYKERAEIPSLRDFAVAHEVDEVVTAMEERRGNLPVRELLECRLAGIRVTQYSGFMEREAGKIDLDAFVPSWLIFSDGSTGGSLRLTAKRAVDLFASVVLLIVTLPFSLLAAVCIKLTSPGPAVFRQERVGQHGETFMLYKFRSMRLDAERDGKPRWATDNDPRVTRVGRIIRKLRIDEIPQIFNVLKGDMSFVGPRPERPFFVEALTRELPYYAERHTVRPGITGWAQVNYPYGASVEDAKQKAQYDLYYIKNFSVFLDILILIKTIRVILFPAGAR